MGWGVVAKFKVFVCKSKSIHNEVGTGGACARERVWRSEDNSIVLVLSIFTWKLMMNSGHHFLWPDLTVIFLKEL